MEHETIIPNDFIFLLQLILLHKYTLKSVYNQLLLQKSETIETKKNIIDSIRRRWKQNSQNSASKIFDLLIVIERMYT